LRFILSPAPDSNKSVTAAATDATGDSSTAASSTGSDGSATAGSSGARAASASACSSVRDPWVLEDVTARADAASASATVDGREDAGASLRTAGELSVRSRRSAATGATGQNRRDCVRCSSAATDYSADGADLAGDSEEDAGRSDR
jgi:hypothetical protein